jgi:type II secretory pathway pseudopilin PulG
MVATAVFSIVMVVAMGALINVIDANQKAQTIKTAINNVNFALESISKDMRVGTNYDCLDEGGFTTDCLSTGNPGVHYISSKKDEAGVNIPIDYLFVASTTTSVGKIQRRLGTEEPQDITSPEVNITSMKFYVVKGTNDDGDKLQPRVVITLSGTAGIREKTKTDFDLQTSVSQRVRANE